MSSARPELSILGVATGRHSKVYKDLLSHNVIQGFSMSSLRHRDVGGVTRDPYILIHNIKESGSLVEGLSGKVIRKLYMVVRGEERCGLGCTVTTSDESGM